MIKSQPKDFVHGGDVYTEGILKGRELLDFSSNINPLGVPQSFTRHMAEAVEAITRYPDIKYRELYKSLVEYIGETHIDEGQLVLGNGAAEIIDFAVGCHKRILIIVPSFVEYEESARKWGCEILYSFLKEDMSFDYEDILIKLRSVEAVVIGHPNNPNGNIIDKSSFRTVLDFCELNRKTVIIDEAFIEFAGSRHTSFIKEMEAYSCIFIIRALTKFFAMPGVRFGYGISRNAKLIQDIKKKQNPWNINCFAETAVRYVLKDQNYISRSLEWIQEERSFLPQGLQEIKFIDRVYKTRCNFVLCKLEGIQGEELYRLCMDRQIVIRRASNFIGLDDSFVRFAIKDRKSNEKLLEILKLIEENL